MGNRINIVTLGCAKNVVDSEKLMKQLSNGGFEVNHNDKDIEGDTVIINTCGFINDAKEESIDTILRFVRAKKEGVIKTLYVMGCLSKRYKKELIKEIPEVNAYFGVNKTDDILQELGIENKVKDYSCGRIITDPGHYAYLKIAEGCNRSCSFCVIPSIRGRYRSRQPEELIREAKQLAGEGVRELILIAQDLSYYGVDKKGRYSLTDLVLRLLDIPELEWIRLHYMYPSGFPEDLIPVIRENPRICRYMDMPVQHISDKMLSLMRRSHNRSQTIDILNRLRDEIPGLAIRTTLIAGHPGETEKEYRELRDFISAFRFDRLGVFAYSHEEGTHSYKMFRDEVPDVVKESRVAGLLEVQRRISADLNEKMVGRVMKVIIDRYDDEYIVARTEYDSPEIDQEVFIPLKYKLRPGQFCDVKIREATDFDLFGDPVNIRSL